MTQPKLLPNNSGAFLHVLIAFGQQVNVVWCRGGISGASAGGGSNMAGESAGRKINGFQFEMTELVYRLQVAIEDPISCDDLLANFDQSHAAQNVTLGYIANQKSVYCFEPPQAFEAIKKLAMKTCLHEVMRKDVTFIQQSSHSLIKSSSDHALVAVFGCHDSEFCCDANCCFRSMKATYILGTGAILLIMIALCVLVTCLALCCTVCFHSKLKQLSCANDNKILDQSQQLCAQQHSTSAHKNGYLLNNQVIFRSLDDNAI